jgi:hypothetical protein
MSSEMPCSGTRSTVKIPASRRQIVQSRPRTAAGKLSQKVTIGQWAGGLRLFRHGWTSASTTHLMTAVVADSSIHLCARSTAAMSWWRPAVVSYSFAGPAARLTAGCVPLLAFA